MPGPYYAQLGGTRILSIDGTTDHSVVDDGDVTGWTKTTEFIVAICIWSGNKDTESSTYKLQWQDDNDGGGYVDLASDAGSPELSYTIDDNSWNHGDTVATGDQVCDIQGGDTRMAGERIKNTSLSDAIDLPDEYQSELWFGVDSSNADDSHQYSFQLYSTAEGAAVGICGATITMSAAATTTSTSTTSTSSTSSTSTSSSSSSTSSSSSSSSTSSTSSSSSSTSTSSSSSSSTSSTSSSSSTSSTSSSSSTSSTSSSSSSSTSSSSSSTSSTSSSSSTSSTSSSSSSTSTSSTSSTSTSSTSTYTSTSTTTPGAQTFYQNVGGGTVAITGDVSTSATFKQAVGGGSVTIAGILITVATFAQAVGGHAMTIAGTLSKVFTQGSGWSFWDWYKRRSRHGHDTV